MNHRPCVVESLVWTFVWRKRWELRRTSKASR